jgi:hypothetical protein
MMDAVTSETHLGEYEMATRKTDKNLELLGMHEMTGCAFDGCKKHTVYTPFCRKHRDLAYAKPRVAKKAA